jgi:hypothetical protein
MQNQYENTTLIVYYISESELNMKTNNLIFKISFYIQAIIGKIIPCCLLGLFIGFIRYNLKIIEIKKDNLLSLNNGRQEQQHPDQELDSVKNKSTNYHDIMLSSVKLLLLMAELPQALLFLCSIFSDYIFLNVYKPLGDLLDVLVLITYPINFFIYCLMSELFRNEFYLLFNLKKV